MAERRRSIDAEIAVIEQRTAQLERRCDDKERKIDALEAFQNRAIGYSMAASFGATLLASYIMQAKGG